MQFICWIIYIFKSHSLTFDSVLEKNTDNALKLNPA